MKILLVHKFYHVVGGPERYIHNLTLILRKNNHRVAFFSMNHRKNRKNQWSKYFVDNISFNKINWYDYLLKFSRMIYSFQAKRNVNLILDKFNPDIIHLRSIYHQISPSILPEIRNRHLPIVQTLGDYHLIAPNYYMFHQEKICEITKKYNFYKAITHKCIKNSIVLSFAEVLEKYIHYILGWERDYIDYFITPSNFLRNKLVEYGINKNKVIYLPHFIDSKLYKPNYNAGDYILYFGRLSSEKGINILLNTMKLLPEIPLKIVGEGAEEKNLKLFVKDEKLKNVEFLGFKDGAELKKIISECRFSILPSIWYEVFGMTILESFALGKPVIASNTGGIPEIIDHGLNGLLFNSGDAMDLKDKILKLWKNINLVRKMGKKARLKAEKKFNPNLHYSQLLKIYNLAIDLYK